jgi:site-specific recombinase XerD
MDEQPKELTEFKKTKKSKEDLQERERFISYLKAKNLKEKTIKDYLFYYDKLFPAYNLNQSNVNRFIEQYNFNYVITATIKNYREFVMTQKRYFPKTIVNRARGVYIPKKTGVNVRKMPEVISEKQVLNIESCMNSERDKLMLLISFYSGIRLEGITSIRVHSFDWEGWLSESSSKENPLGRFKVVEKGDKDRIVYLPYSIMKRLHSYIQDEINKGESFDGETPLFKIGKRRWQQLLEKASKSAGIPIHPHTLRHSFATMALKRGVKIEKIKDLLGHKNINTTMIYTRITQEDLEKDFNDTLNF